MCCFHSQPVTSFWTGQPKHCRHEIFLIPGLVAEICRETSRKNMTTNNDLYRWHKSTLKKLTTIPRLLSHDNVMYRQSGKTQDSHLIHEYSFLPFTEWTATHTHTHATTGNATIDSAVSELHRATSQTIVPWSTFPRISFNKQQQNNW